jgi:hypothetical protein
MQIRATTHRTTCEAAGGKNHILKSRSQCKETNFRTFLWGIFTDYDAVVTTVCNKQERGSITVQNKHTEVLTSPLPKKMSMENLFSFRRRQRNEYKSWMLCTSFSQPLLIQARKTDTHTHTHTHTSMTAHR